MSKLKCPEEVEEFDSGRETGFNPWGPATLAVCAAPYDYAQKEIEDEYDTRLVARRSECSPVHGKLLSDSTAIFGLIDRVTLR